MSALKLVFPVIAVLMVASECSAAILFDGKNIGYEFINPDTLTIPVSNSFLVGAGVERQNLSFADPSTTGEAATLNVQDTSVTVDFYAGGTFSPGGPPIPFVGFRLFDLGGLNALATITGITGTSAVGFTGGSPVITFDADNIFVDFKGLDFTAASILEFNVSSLAAPAAVPEPASAAFLGLGSLALVVRRLRRRTSVVA